MAIVGFLVACAVGNHFLYGSVVKPPQPAAQLVALETHPLASLGREMGVSGGFVLGVGLLDAKIYYVSYETKGNDTFALLKIPAEGVDVTETDGEAPCYQLWGRNGMVEKRTLVVPKGTIKKDFKL